MGSSGGCDSLPARIPSFFKIILESAIQEKRLGIPRKFVEEYGNDLPECVTLEVPDGAQWQIKLTKTKDGQVWMEQGWLDFANHYSLSFGKFLAFSPQGFSKFLVVIFDVTAMEIKYAPLITSGSKSRVDRENLLVKNPHKRERANSCGTCESGSSVGTECGSVRLKKAKKDADLRVSSREFEGKSASFANEKRAGGNIADMRPCPLLYKEVKKSTKFQDGAKEVMTAYPWFEVVMKNSYVHGSYLAIPTSFARNYIKTGRSTTKLNVGDKSWRVNLFSYHSTAKISCGWIAFAKENALKPKDICKFELISLNDCIFRVSISRNTSDSTKPAGLENVKRYGGDVADRRSGVNLWDESKKSTKVKNEADEFTRTYPWFLVEMEDAYIQGWCLNLPSSFARNYIKTGASTIKLNVGDKSWRVNLFKYRDGVCKISSGWHSFVRENTLKPKDICQFELIQRKDCFFRVSIGRNTGNSD